MTPRPLLLSALLVLLPFSAAFAEPLGWENDYGDPITALTGEDDDQAEVTLSFPFPYEGDDHTSVWVGTNGAVQLGGLGTDGLINYEIWETLAEFYDDGGFPVLAPFASDFNLTRSGTIHFRDFGDRAVITWSEVGSNLDLDAVATFQLQLYADGTIRFSYNDILVVEGADLLTDLGEGILVGISGSTGTDPGPLDLSQPQTTATDTLYELWRYNQAPDNSLFDLDQQTLVFTPRTGGGFSSQLLALAPARPDLLIGKKPGALKGDGIRNTKKASAKQTIEYQRRAFQTNTSTAHLALQNDGGSAAPLRLRTSGDTQPRMTVKATAVGSGNITAALRSGRFAPVIPAGGNVRVTYRLSTERFFAGVKRGGDRDDTIRFRLTSGNQADNAAMVNEYQ